VKRNPPAVPALFAMLFSASHGSLLFTGVSDADGGDGGGAPHGLCEDFEWLLFFVHES
jgi:hypothetical protein